MVSWKKHLDKGKGKLLNLFFYIVFITVFAGLSPAAAQLSNAYPNDIGIETDSDVLYVEQFEDGLASIFSRYQDKKNTAGMSLTPDVPPGSLGLYSLKMTNVGGANSGGHLYRQFTPGWDSTVYVRYYVKYPAISQGYIHHEAVWFGGYNPATPWPNPQAGTCGLGDKRISVAYEPISSNNMNTYLYWGEMHHDPNNNCWGNVLIKGDWAAAPVPFDDWLCVEVMVKLNNPTTASNGELQIWHNGVEVGHWGPGYPNGSWTWDKFIVNANDPPFSGFRWRTDPNLNINYLWIEFYDDQSPLGESHYILFDHLVVAKKRIGPIYTQNSTGVSSVVKPLVRAYPNPAGDLITFNLDDAIPTNAALYINDFMGSRVLSADITATAFPINISGLKAGIYYWTLQTGRKQEAGVFVKQ